MGFTKGAHTAPNLSAADRKKLDAAMAGESTFMRYFFMLAPMILVVVFPALFIWCTVQFDWQFDFVMVKLHQLFAWQGDVDSKFRLATLHYHGTGVEKSMPLVRRTRRSSTGPRLFAPAGSLPWTALPFPGAAVLCFQLRMQSHQAHVSMRKSACSLQPLKCAPP